MPAAGSEVGPAALVFWKKLGRPGLVSFGLLLVDGIRVMFVQDDIICRGAASQKRTKQDQGHSHGERVFFIAGIKKILVRLGRDLNLARVSPTTTLKS